jgi:argininosuccinate lyase
MGLLTTLKALPLSYNRDLQEDKVHLFQGLDTVKSSLALMRLMLEKAAFNPARMSAALKGDFSNATDLADGLARKGIPFREAHEVVGILVRDCLEKKKALEDLSLAELQKYSPLFDETIRQSLPHSAVMRARTSEGGTSPAAVSEQLKKARAQLQR